MCKAEAAIRTQRVGPGRKGQARLGCPWGQREEARAPPHRETWRTGGGHSPGPTSGKEEGAQGAPRMVLTNFSTGYCIITTERKDSAEKMKGLHWNMLLTTGLTFQTSCERVTEF